MTPSGSADPKIKGRWKQVAIIFQRAELQSILSQNSLPWQQGSSGKNSNDTIGKRKPENRGLGENS